MTRTRDVALCAMALITSPACGPRPTPSGVGGSGGGGSGGGSSICDSLRPGDTTGTMQFGGALRTYLVHVPPNRAPGTPVPLLVDMHGIFLDAQIQRGLSNYVQFADREGFIIVFPNGIDNAWNIGPCCTFSRTVDDVGFLRALVGRFTSAGCVDPKRVYAAGYSMGGGMSHYLACNAGDVFAAVAPAAFDLLQEAPCAPTRPITVVSFRGTADFIVPYAGGPSRPPNGLNTTINFLGAERTFTRWAELNRCTGQPAAALNGCRTYAQCASGVEVTFCSTLGGSHVAGDANIAWPILKRYTLP
jgi:polyhydroxybutyrate depolymerase